MNEKENRNLEFRKMKSNAFTFLKVYFSKATPFKVDNPQGNERLTSALIFEFFEPIRCFGFFLEGSVSD